MAAILHPAMFHCLFCLFAKSVLFCLFFFMSHDYACLGGVAAAMQSSRLPHSPPSQNRCFFHSCPVFLFSHE